MLVFATAMRANRRGVAVVDSLDTNLLARYYLDDDPAQADIAQAILNGEGPLFVAASVVIELVWVLGRGGPGLSRPRVVAILRHLLSVPSVHIEHEATIEAAMEAYARGLDFGDALHLASSARCTRLLSFDRKFVARARRLGLRPRCEAPRAAPP